jgi:hypothetical protein
VSSHATHNHCCGRVYTVQVYGGGTGDEELLVHVMDAAQAPLWLLSKPWLQQGACLGA